jgi:WD40 repeat protein
LCLTFLLFVCTCCSLQTIPGQDGLELSSLAWAKAEAEEHWRLFCATLTGDIYEVDCQRLTRVAPTDSYGGAVWALSSCPGSSVHPSNLLAAGCDDGSVRLFSVQAGLPGAAFQRTLAQVEGRCLALAWHPTASLLLSGGSDGAIHCWDTTTGV